MKKNIAFLLITILFSLPGFSQEKFGPTPTKEQLAWHDKEFYFFNNKPLIIFLLKEFKPVALDPFTIR